MYALMGNEIVTNTQSFTANSKRTRALTTRYVLLCYKTSLFTKWLFTQITSIMALTTMYVVMTYQTALYNECLITYFT